METWKSYLQADPTNWLLEPNNPSVRYMTLCDLLEKPEANKDVKDAKQNIMKYRCCASDFGKTKGKRILGGP